MLRRFITGIFLISLALGFGEELWAANITVNSGLTVNMSSLGLAAADNLTIRTGSTVVVDGTFTLNNLTLASNTTNGTLTFNSGSQLTINGTPTIGGATSGIGTINMTSGGRLVISTNPFTVNGNRGVLTAGTGTISIGAGMTLPAAFTTYNNLEINRGGATINLGVNTICTGDAKILAGTLSTTGAAFNLSIADTFNIAAGSTFTSNNAVVTSNGVLLIAGTYTHGGGSTVVKNNFINNGTFTPGAGTLIFGGTTTMSGTTSPMPCNSVTINAGSTLTLPTALTLATNWTNNGGTVNVGTGLVTFSSNTAQVIGGTATTHTFYNLTVNKAGGTVTFGPATTTLTANNLTLTAGGFTACPNINLTGNFAFTAGTFTHNSGLITFNGTGAQTLPGANVTFNKITVNKTAGTLTQNANCTINGTLTVSAGTYNVAGNTITAGGASNLVMTGGDIQFGNTFGATSPPFTNCNLTGGTISLNNATFLGFQTLRSGISYYNVVLGGASAKTTTGVTSIQNNLTISGTATMTGNGALTVGGTVNYTSTGTTTLTAATNVSFGSFVQSAGTLVDNGNQITITGSNWTRTGGTFTSTGKVIFSSNASISLAGPTVTTFSKIFKTGTGTLTTSANTVVNSELNISSGIFDISTNTLTGTGALNMSGGTLRIATVGATVPSLSGAFALTGGTVELYGAGAQSVALTNYYNLTLSGGTKTFLAGTTSIAVLLQTIGNPTVDLRTNATTLNFNGTGVYVNQNIPALNYHSLSFGSASGTKTFQLGTTKIRSTLTSSGALGDALTNSTTIEFDGTTAQAVSGTLIPSYYNLTNSNAAGLTCSGVVSLYNTMTLSGSSVFNSTGTLKFKSSASNTARLAEVPNTASFNGDIVFERYAPAIGALGLHNYHIMGAPVNGSGFSALYYNENNTGDINTGFGVGSCDTCVSTINVGAGGFKDLGASATVYTYGSATPNIGTKVVGTTFTTSSFTDADGWNLLSNPYPCEILWDNVLLNNVGSSAYLWNGAQYDEYLQGDGLVIPAGQGFWVRAFANGNVTFQETDKITTANPTFLRQTNTPAYPKLVLKMVGNGISDLTDVRFQTGASTAFDPEFDAHKLKGNANAPYLATINTAQEKIAINSYPELNQNYDIPLIARCTASGNFQLQVESMNGFPTSACIFLEDLVTGQFYDLRTTNNINFTQVGNSNNTERFILHFGAPVALTVSEASCTNGNYFGSAHAMGQAGGPWTYIWKDAAGNTLQTNTNTNGPADLSNLPAGSYTLQIQNSNGLCSSATETFHVTGHAFMEANPLLTSPSCHGLSDGAIQLNATGGQDSLSIHWSVSGSNASQLNMLEAGVYTVSLTDAAGCTALEEIELTEPEAVMAAFTPTTPTVYLSDGGWVGFTNQSSGANTYTWNFGDGSAEYTGTTAAHQYNAAGLYTVRLTARNGVCDNSQEQEIRVESNPTGLSGPNASGALSVMYTNGLIRCTFGLPNIDEAAFSLSNSLGQQVLNTVGLATNNQSLEIPIKPLAQGIYFASISFNGKVETRKIFIP